MIPDFKLSLSKEVPKSKIVLRERLVQRFLFQWGLHIKFLLLKGLAEQYASFDDGNITLLPGFYFMFIFPSPYNTTLEKMQITHLYPRLPPAMEKWQRFRSPAAGRTRGKGWLHLCERGFPRETLRQHSS